MLNTTFTKQILCIYYIDVHIKKSPRIHSCNTPCHFWRDTQNIVFARTLTCKNINTAHFINTQPSLKVKWSSF